MTEKSGATDDAAIKPFRIAISDEILSDLKSRLARTRWPEAELVDDWSQGAPLKWIQEISGYWAEMATTGARVRQSSIASSSSRPRLTGSTSISLHARSKEPNALPLIITHGWPGSIVEFQKVIAPLTDPVAHGGDAADAFHVDLPVAAGLWLLGETKDHRLGRRPHRCDLGQADGSPRLRALRRAGRRLGLGGDDLARCDRTLEHCAGIHITLAFNAAPKVEGDPTPERSARSPASSITSILTPAIRSNSRRVRRRLVMV